MRLQFTPKRWQEAIGAGVVGIAVAASNKHSATPKAATVGTTAGFQTRPSTTTSTSTSSTTTTQPLAPTQPSPSAVATVAPKGMKSAIGPKKRSTTPGQKAGPLGSAQPAKRPISQAAKIPTARPAKVPPSKLRTRASSSALEHS